MDAALATDSAFDAAVLTIETALETTLIALAACAEIADASVLVTLPEPPTTWLILFESILMTF